MNLLSGTTVNSDGTHPYNLTTLLVAPYELRNTSAKSCAWDVKKWYITYNNQPGQTDLDNFYFTNVTVNSCGAFDMDARTVTAQWAGYYYIWLQSGAGIGKDGSTFSFLLKKAAQTVFGIEHKSTAEGSTDMFGHGQVVYLDKGDVLSVTAVAPSYIYSSNTSYEVQWSGMFLY
jgi:hypothetical protein